MQGQAITRRQMLAAGAALGLGMPASCRPSAAPRRPNVTETDIARFGDALTGTLLIIGDRGYDAARRVASFNPRTDYRPFAVARCASRSDVQRTIAFSREHSLPLAVRGGGNDVLGQSSVDRGVVLDLSLMSDIALDDRSGVVKVEGGALAGTVVNSLAPHGLTVPLGCDPSVGVGGLTLGGGLGWLVSSAGAACDNVVRFELVDAEGHAMAVDAETDPDLFWALKGGGGNFGVVTGFGYRPLEIDRVVSGYLVFPVETAGDFLAAYDGLMDRAPRELTAELALLDTAAGQVLVAMICFAGHSRNAEPAIAPFRRITRPIADTIAIQPYPAVGAPSPELIAAFPPVQIADEDRAAQASGGGFNHWRGTSVARLAGGAIDILLDAIRTAPPGWSIGLGHHQRGAFLDSDETMSSLPRVAGASSLYVSASWYRPAMTRQSMGWVDRTMDRLSPYAMERTYVNYLSSDAPGDVAAAYGANYARLAEIKSRVDPENIFQRNRNIIPA